MSLFRRKPRPRLAEQLRNYPSYRFDVFGDDHGPVMEVEIEFVHCPGCPDCQAALDRLMQQPQVQALIDRYARQQAEALDAELADLIEGDGRR